MTQIYLEDTNASTLQKLIKKILWLNLDQFSIYTVTLRLPSQRGNKDLTYFLKNTVTSTIKMFLLLCPGLQIPPSLRCHTRLFSRDYRGLLENALGTQLYNHRHAHET